ncbi:Aste57867_1388 [Aphanomyces stellatus]|uniref:Aste57867_1388 protein n=1 Tax=Aphanomyces stellatus TaxID=120398 RepID=A0A485K5H9_9STRA|nr:hypothetical protein As57867_001387 [Aphanomyces stellatus]VFT78605.1 Aste57867_1388 [Aphanomyces stellatus]
MSSRRGSVASRASGHPRLGDIATDSGIETLDAAATFAMASTIAMSSWLRFKGGFFKGWTMYYVVLSRTNQLTAYSTDDYQGKPWKFRVQAMMVQPNRSIHLGFVVTTLKDGAITLAASSGAEYQQWIRVLSEKQPIRPPLTRTALHARDHPTNQDMSPPMTSVNMMERSKSVHLTKEILLYVPTHAIPLQCGAGDLVAEARAEIKSLETEMDQHVPHRGDLDDPAIEWRIGKPEYALVDLVFLKGKTFNHAAPSLEWTIQNLMKKWEMEVSHKANVHQWTTTHPQDFKMQVNMGPTASLADLHAAGKYDGLLSHCPCHVYDAHDSSRERSTLAFASIFPAGFAWEVLQVFSPPPRVSFSWRHWGHCLSKPNKDDDGELVELLGFAILDVAAGVRITNMELFFKPEPFFEALRRHDFNEVPPPVSRQRRASAPSVAAHDDDDDGIHHVSRRPAARRATVLHPHAGRRPAATSLDDMQLEEFLRCPHRSITSVHASNVVSPSHSTSHAHHTMAV